MELYALNFSPPATDHGSQFTDHIPLSCRGFVSRTAAARPE
jgi:hypothetical protein